MVRKEELGKIEKIETNAFQTVDYIAATNQEWVFLRDTCKENRGIDGGFRFLCSHKDNTSKVPQERSCRRCALPWCPQRVAVSQVASGRACWLPEEKMRKH
jgi:hypothetical protein